MQSQRPCSKCDQYVRCGDQWPRMLNEQGLSAGLADSSKVQPAPPEWTRLGYKTSRIQVPRSSSRRPTCPDPDWNSFLGGSTAPSPLQEYYKNTLEMFFSSLFSPALSYTKATKVTHKHGGRLSQKPPFCYHPPPTQPPKSTGFRVGGIGSGGLIFWLNKFQFVSY